MACSQAPTPPEEGASAPPGNGQFADAVEAGPTVYLSGQTADSAAAEAGVSAIEASTRGAMDKLGAVLGARGLAFSNLVNCRLQLADMDDYQTVNGIYASYFSDERYPARTTVQVAALPDNARIAVTCIAYADVAATAIVRPSPEVIPPAMGPYSPATRIVITSTNIIIPSSVKSPMDVDTSSVILLTNTETAPTIVIKFYTL
jgi:2-iminobutanoate/2-iminopropanoate deaminase